MTVQLRVPTTSIIEKLYHIPDNSKAEIINGEIVRMSPTGGKPGRIGGKIYIYLDEYERQTGRGYAFPDNVGFIVDLPNRSTFSPDAAYYLGELEEDNFLVGAPVFAVEVRSKNDYGPKAERLIKEKIGDYFQARTLVVWDVDVHHQLIHAYRASEPTNPITFQRGDQADAEPALPGWRLPVYVLFR
jgi:Uma2 family endonuclease